MALIALTTAHTVQYVSNMDPSKVRTFVPVDPEDPEKGVKEHIEVKEDASYFTLRPLDVFLMGYIYDNASHIRGKQGDSEIGVHTRVNQTNIDAVRFGLAALPDNFKDAKGNPIRYRTVKEVVNGRSYDAVDRAVLDTLGLYLIGELAGEIKRISEVSGDQAKKSV